LKNLQVPSEIVARIRDDQRRARGKVSNERTLLESRLTAIRNRMDKAYSDKLDGKIAEEFWQRLMTEWRMEEQQVKMAIQDFRTHE
jgi:chorismate mutase